MNLWPLTSGSAFGLPTYPKPDKAPQPGQLPEYAPPQQSLHLQLLPSQQPPFGTRPMPTPPWSIRDLLRPQTVTGAGSGGDDGTTPLGMTPHPQQEDTFLLENPGQGPGVVRGDEDPSTTVPLVRGDTALHTAVRGEGRAKVRDALLAHPEELGARNRNGDTPLHVAAFYGKLGMVVDLLNAKTPTGERVANIYDNTAQGLTAAHLALAGGCTGGPSVALELAQAGLEDDNTFEPLWYTVSGIKAIEKAHTEMGRDFDHKGIKKLTKTLTGTSLDLDDYDLLMRSNGHARSWTGSDFGVDVEGFVPHIGLTSRIRVLLEILHAPQLLSQERLVNVSPSVRDYLEKHPDELRQHIYEELAARLELLRQARRHYWMLVAGASDGRSKVIELETRNLVHQIETAGPQGFPMVLGWSGHAVYGNFLPVEKGGKPHLTFMLHNLGDRPSGTHATDPELGLVSPSVINIPRDFLATKTGQTAFSTFVSELLKADALRTDASQVYSAMRTLQTALVNARRAELTSLGMAPEHIEKELMAYRESMVDGSHIPDFEGEDEQRAGNCSWFNLDSGTKPRRGKVVATLIALAEQETLERLLQHVLSHEGMQQKDRKMVEQELRQLLAKHRDPHMAAKLRHKLEAPSHKDWASKLKYLELRRLVERQQVEALDVLLEHGANPNAMPKHSDLVLDGRLKDDSLLHVAVRTGNGKLVETLAKHGADISRRNPAGRTPYEEAVFRQADSCLAALKEYYEPKEDETGSVQALAIEQFLKSAAILETLGITLAVPVGITPSGLKTRSSASPGLQVVPMPHPVGQSISVGGKPEGGR